ncbi:MAG TPA: hypothetical protein VF041_23365 [Gemmatimonadaceae bacterium]
MSMWDGTGYDSSIWGPQTGLRDIFLQQNPQSAFSYYLERLGSPADPFHQYFAQNYGRLYNRFQNAASYNPQLQWADFLPGQELSLRNEFNLLPASQRNDLSPFNPAGRYVS